MEWNVWNSKLWKHKFQFDICASSFFSIQYKNNQFHLKCFAYGTFFSWKGMKPQHSLNEFRLECHEYGKTVPKNGNVQISSFSNLNCI